MTDAAGNPLAIDSVSVVNLVDSLFLLDYEPPSNFNDKGGTNHPTNINVTTTTVAQVTGTVARFVSGSSAELVLPVAAEIPAGASYTKFCVIVMRTSWAGVAQNLVTSDNMETVFWKSGPDELRAFHGNGNFTTPGASLGGSNIGGWSAGEVHTLAVTFEPAQNRMRLYIDGVQDAEDTNLTTGVGLSDTLRVGSYDSGFFLNQDLSYTATWLRELTATEIQRLHDLHAGGE